jgi:hypothetical protein
VTAKNKTAVLRSLVVEENHSRLRAFDLWLLFAAHDDTGQLRVIGNHHAQRPIRLDHIDALRGDLFENLIF